MSDRPRLTVGAAMPDMAFTWRDSSEAVIPFLSQPHTFQLRIATAPLFLKGVLGGDQTGISVANTAPNVIVQWTQGELDWLIPGFYSGQLWAQRTSDGRRRSPLRFDVEIERAVAGSKELALVVSGVGTISVSDVL
jgi:hypothetical protein